MQNICRTCEWLLVNLFENRYSPTVRAPGGIFFGNIQDFAPRFSWNGSTVFPKKPQLILVSLFWLSPFLPQQIWPVAYLRKDVYIKIIATSNHFNENGHNFQRNFFNRNTRSRKPRQRHLERAIAEPRKSLGCKTRRTLS